MTTIAPNDWFGESECLVGPFWRRSLAEAFTGRGVDFGHLAAYSFGIVQLSDEGWYVVVQRSQAVEA